MPQVISGGSDATIAASTTVFACPMGYHGAYPTTDATAFGVIPTGGTINLLALRPSGNPTATITGTLYLNGSPTSLTCTFSTNTIGHDSTHSIAVVAGDKVSFQIAVGSGASLRTYSWSVVFTPTISGETILLSNSNNTNLVANNVTSLASPRVPTSTETFAALVTPETGTLKKLYVVLDGDPTLGTVITKVRINGADGNCSVSITTGSTAGNDTTHSDSITVGDRINFKTTTSLSPTLTPAHYGLVYVSPTPGNFIVMGSSAGNGISTGARHIPPYGQRAVTTAAESFVFNAFTAKSLFTRLTTPPGAGTAYDHSLTIGGTNTALLVSIAGTNSTATVTANVTVALNDLLDFTTVATIGTPSTSGPWYIGIVGFIAEASTSTNFFLMF